MTREEAIEWIENIKKKYIHGGDEAFDDARRKAVDMAIEALQAEPKHGKWVEEKNGWYGGKGCRCSSCGYGYSYKAYHEPYEFDFCPSCGAKMDKE